MKRSIFTLLFLLLIAGAYGQSRKCATMEVLEKQTQNNPEMAQRFESMQQRTEEKIEQTGRTENHSQLNLPALPGFTPTGDPHTDLVQFGIAKEKLYREDPDRYRELTRNPTSHNQRKTKK